MEKHVPRVVIAGTNSGCGKTTVTCALLQALCDRGKSVCAFKCGPDYIDPMFHKKIIGTHSSNLDMHLFDDNTLRYLLAKNGAEHDISVIEGVMGFYDGVGINSTCASTYEIAKATKSPAILVVNARGAAMSVLAVIHGFLTMTDDNNICGVILNQCTDYVYKMIAREIETRYMGRVRPIGYLPIDRDCMIESRHLGLVTAEEIHDLHKKLDTLSKYAEKCINIDELLEIAASASAVSCEPVHIPRFKEHVRIAVARDDAFCFYYEDSLKLLEDMGAELIYFSPISDSEIPENIHGIYLGGGYPELYSKQLSENKTMLISVKRALERDVPCIAECGGFMYLTEYIGAAEMVGAIPGKCKNMGKLTRFGYVMLKAKADNMLCDAGEIIPAHEFHHWDSDNIGTDFTAFKLSGASYDSVVATDHLYAGFPHFHFYSDLRLAERFYKACAEEKRSNMKNRIKAH